MSASHTTFILAAYLITFAVIGGTVAAIVIRHRALKRALARFDKNGAP